MSSDENPFDLLGIEPSASAKELRRAYLRRVKEHPPERDPETFQRLRQAYEAAQAIHDAQPTEEPEASDALAQLIASQGFLVCTVVEEREDPRADLLRELAEVRRRAALDEPEEALDLARELLPRLKEVPADTYLAWSPLALAVIELLAHKRLDAGAALRRLVADAAATAGRRQALQDPSHAWLAAGELTTLAERVPPHFVQLMAAQYLTEVEYDFDPQQARGSVTPLVRYAFRHPLAYARLRKALEGLPVLDEARDTCWYRVCGGSPHMIVYGLLYALLLAFMATTCHSLEI